MLPQSLSRAWRTKSWMKRLSGLTLGHSTASRGVEKWVASLGGILASHSLSPVSDSGRPTQDTFGQTSEESSERFSQNGVSSRTSATTYEWASRKSMTTFSKWVSELRRVCLRRKKLVLLTRESGCSFCPTPSLQEGGQSIPKDAVWRGTTAYKKDGTKKMWTTPQAHDVSPRGKGNRQNPKAGNACLAWDAMEFGKAFHCFPQGQKNSTGGEKSLSKDRTLNHLFVEYLMGWTIGWTDCERAVTEWSRWWRRMRTELLRLLSLDTACRICGGVATCAELAQ